MLGASRIWGQVGPQAIQISEIKAYLDLVEIDDPEERGVYVRHIKRLDHTEIQVWNEKREKASK